MPDQQPKVPADLKDTGKGRRFVWMPADAIRVVPKKDAPPPPEQQA